MAQRRSRRSDRPFRSIASMPRTATSNRQMAIAADSALASQPRPPALASEEAVVKAASPSEATATEPAIHGALPPRQRALAVRASERPSARWSRPKAAAQSIRRGAAPPEAATDSAEVPASVAAKSHGIARCRRQSRSARSRSVSSSVVPAIAAVSAQSTESSVGRLRTSGNEPSVFSPARCTVTTTASSPASPTIRSSIEKSTSGGAGRSPIRTTFTPGAKISCDT